MHSYNDLREMSYVTMEKKNTMCVILILSLAALIGCMNVTLFNVALPAMMLYFNTDVITIQWLVSGYTLAAGIITPAVGFLGDKFGYKRLMSLIAFMVAVLSIAGVFAWCIEVLIVIRVFLGLTAGMLTPLSLAMMYQFVPRQNQEQAAGVWGAACIAGGATPSVLAGFAVMYASWHVLLLLMVPFALLLLIGCIKYLPERAVSNSMKIDVTGFALTSIGSFVLLFTFSNLSKWGPSVKFFVAVCIGLAIMICYFIKSWNKKDAVLSLYVLRYPRYVAALFADAMNVIGLQMIVFVLPLFLQNGMGISAALTGTILLPVSLVTILATPLATKILISHGEKMVAIIGVVFLLLGSAVFLRIDPQLSVLVIVGAMCVRSFGMAFLKLMATNTCMAAVPTELSGHASALRTWIDQLLTALVVSMSSTVISIRLVLSDAQTLDEISTVYLSSTEMLFTISCIVLLCIIPVALKFFRGKNEMND